MFSAYKSTISFDLIKKNRQKNTKLRVWQFAALNIAFVADSDFTVQTQYLRTVFIFYFFYFLLFSIAEKSNKPACHVDLSAGRKV
jgi:hypothetical protein